MEVNKMAKTNNSPKTDYRIPHINANPNLYKNNLDNLTNISSYLGSANYSSLYKLDSDGVPDAPSNEATVKPYTNGLNTAQALTLAAGAFGVYGNYLSSRAQVKAYNAQAQEYDTQRLLNYDAYRQQIRSWAESNLYDVNRIQQEYGDFASEQLASIGASQFDVSAGEQRVLRDTEIKAEDAKYLANRSMYLQSVELQRSTDIENARLLAAAKTARIQAKYAKKMGRISLIAGIVGTAANVAAMGSYGRTNDTSTKGTTSKA